MPSVSVAAVVTHARAATVAPAIARLEAVAQARERRARVRRETRSAAADIAVVLGGDGTMLRALARFHGTGDPGDRRQLRPRRLPDGDHRRRARGRARARVRGRLPDRRAARPSRSRWGARRSVAVNDVVVAGATLGRMVELGHAIGGEELGVQPCDGLICATPAGSTAYNLSNGGPVLVWGLDAMVLTFVAPHALDVRPLVVPRGLGHGDHEPHDRRSTRPCWSTGTRSDGSRTASRPSCGSAAARACSRRCRRSRSSAGTAPRSATERPTAAAPYDDGVLRTLRIENLVLIHEAELELDEQLTAITGETGAGKTILSNAIGLLLGARGDAALIGAAGDEAYVEAEFDAVDDEVLGPLAELRPDGEDGLVLARRIFADGRTRAYAWGRAAAREDVAAAAEALIAMSGQFEQRRLCAARVPARRARRLRRARRAPPRRTDRLARAGRRAAGARGADAGRRRGRGAPRRAARARRRHRRARSRAARPSSATSASACAASTSSSRRPPGRPTRSRRTRAKGRPTGSPAAERLIAPLEQLAPELAAAGSTLREAELALRETVHELRAFLASLEAEPGRLEQVEASLDEIATLQTPLRRRVVRGAAGARRRGPRRAGRARGGPRPGARGRRGARRGRGRGRAAARRAARGPPGGGAPVRRRGGAGAGRRRPRRRRVPGRAARARARRDRRRRGGRS